jgi:NAD(P)-dependent dehydrogenase (short-subunit alcohol dehydrogenase family)
MSGVMIVTGGGRGIGAAIARRGAQSGYAVCINYSRARDKAQAVADEIEAAGGKAICVQADIAVEAEVISMFEEVDAKLGPVTALVNNAGIDYEVLIRDFELEQLQRMFSVNVFGLMVCSREAIRRMAKSSGGDGGVIVNVGSISARYGGLPMDVGYASSKGAVDSFTKGLAREVGPEGIRVVCVRPGLTRTEIFDEGMGLEEVVTMAKTSVPLGRIGEPVEVANMVVWLCSPEASYVTGFAYDVSGGR